MLKVGVSARCNVDLSEFDFIPDIVMAVFCHIFLAHGNCRLCCVRIAFAGGPVGRNAGNS